MANPLIQPTKAVLKQCSIAGVSFNDGRQNNFHVKEFRIFEDICKPYFTAELVIETIVNVYEMFLHPTAEVIISFECPRSDMNMSSIKAYTERFRVYSYDSKPIKGGADVRIEHKISLIGQEYYNDKHNVVIRNFKNQTGTAAAQTIHNEFMKAQGAGGMQVTVPSVGMIGLDRVAHQVINKKPMKAIHDILSRCVWSTYKSCAPVYFRRKQGYVISPMQFILENGPQTGNFVHSPGIGSDLKKTFLGYNEIIDIKPLSPPGQQASGVAASDISGMLKSLAFLDIQKGHLQNVVSQLQNILKMPFVASNPKLKSSVQQMLAEAQKSKFGGMNIFSYLDQKHQTQNIDKNGPGGYNVAQEALVAALTYSQKYWVSVPGQTGLNVTCGDKIQVVFPIANKYVQKTLFVPRLIHEVRFTEGDKRVVLEQNARTEIYGVAWNG